MRQPHAARSDLLAALRPRGRPESRSEAGTGQCGAAPGSSSPRAGRTRNLFLQSDDRLDGRAGRQCVQDARNGHSFDRSRGPETAADKSATGPDEAWTADLNVLNVRVNDFSQHLRLRARDDDDPVLKETHVVCPSRGKRCCRHVPAEEGDLGQAGNGTGIKLGDFLGDFNGSAVTLLRLSIFGRARGKSRR